MCSELEVYPESELHDPRITRKRGDLCRGPGAYIAARRGKQRVIENVEDLPAELGSQAFGDWEILDQGSIEDIGSGRVERVAGAVANHSIAGIGKGIASGLSYKGCSRAVPLE